jgi:hypothetical protein
MGIKVIFASTAALVLVAGAPAHAARDQAERASATDSADGVAAGAAAKEERKTCRTYANSASRMKRERLCLTRQQWKKFDAEQSGQ